MRLLSVAIIALAIASPAAAQEAGQFAGEVTASRLKLRAGPGEAYQPVVMVEKGAQLVVLGKHANDTSWYQVEVPGGYTAWVAAQFVKKGADGYGTIAATRLLVRPKPSTRYHQLSGRLNKGERVKIVGEKSTAEGRWFQVRVPRRIPLYAHKDYIKNAGPVSIIDRAKSDPKRKPRALVIQTGADKRFSTLEPEIRGKLARSRRAADFEPMRKAVAQIDRRDLSVDNRERRVKLLADILEKEREVVIVELKQREDKVKGDLEAKLKEIERRYKKRLAEIREEFEKSKKPRFTATGIVQWRPDIVGRYPSFRLAEGGKLRYYLISTQFDLSRFKNKRVGIVGLKDPESGTGYETIVVRRIEILGDE